MQKRFGIVVAAALAASAALIVGCVELTGQRISWFHDQANDELRFVLCYDGVHDNKKEQGDGGGMFSDSTKGAEQLPKFVAAGDVMLLDWFGHLKRETLDKSLKDPELAAPERQLLERLKGVRVETIAHYRDDGGRIGAVQRVVIKEISKVLDGVNATLCESILDEMIGETGEFPRSRKLLIDAAKAGHRFVSLDGHAFVVNVPLDRVELREMRRDKLEEMLEDALEESERGKEESKFIARAISTALSSVSLSWIEVGDSLRVVIGDREKPNTLRFLLRPDYEPSLEADVARLIPAQLNALIAPALVNAPAPPSPAVADFIAFGPPEEVALALARAADAKSADSAKARACLQGLRDSWNANVGIPQAPWPAEGSPADAPLTPAWTEWARKVQGR